MPRRKSVPIAIALISITSIAMLVQWLSPRDNPVVEISTPRSIEQPDETRQQEKQPQDLTKHALDELKKRYFNEAVVMLHAKRYDYAVTALHELLRIAPKMPEAHANMGFALLGLKRYKAASDFFNTALDLNPNQINAYFGLALAEEKLNHIPISLASMEVYVHRSPKDDPFLSKARGKIDLWSKQIDAERMRKAQGGNDNREPVSAPEPTTGKGP